MFLVTIATVKWLPIMKGASANAMSCSFFFQLACPCFLWVRKCKINPMAKSSFDTGKSMKAPRSHIIILQSVYLKGCGMGPWLVLVTGKSMKAPRSYIIIAVCVP